MYNTNKNFVKAELFGFDVIINGNQTYGFKLKNNR